MPLWQWVPCYLAPERRRIRSALATALALVAGTLAPISARADGQGWGSLNGLVNAPPWLDLGLNLTAEPLGNPAGGTSQSAAWIQQLTFNVEAGTGIGKERAQWSEFDHWKVHAQLMLFNGDPFLNETIGAAFPLQTASHPVGLWPTELSLQRSRGNGPLFVKAGIISVNPTFIEAPAYDNYIHSALNNTLNALVVGLPINPFTAPGVAAHPTTGGSSELRIGAFLLGDENAIASVFGVDPMQPRPEGNLQLVQWNLKHLPGSKAVEAPIPTPKGPVQRQLPAPLLQVGSVRADTTLESQDAVGIGAGENWGAYGSLTLPVQLPLALDHRIWIAGRVGFNPQNNPAPTYLGVGWLSQGVVPGRPLDVLALGFGRTSFSPAITPFSSYEAVVELNYNYTVNSNLSLQPLVQWIVNPGGTGTTPGIFATGLQLTLQF